MSLTRSDARKTVKNLIRPRNYLQGHSKSTKSPTISFAGYKDTFFHAVMDLNKEDGGKRKFILITNNENDICLDIAYERLKRVIYKENYTANLKYFRI